MQEFAERHKLRKRRMAHKKRTDRKRSGPVVSPDG
jgi:hypothetical protein